VFCLSLLIMSLASSDCRHLSHHHSSYFLLFCMYVHMNSASYFVRCWHLVSCKPHHQALIIYSRVSEPVGHGRIFNGSRQGNIEIEYIWQVELLTKTNNKQAWPSHWLQRTSCHWKLFLFLLCACARVVAIRKCYSRWTADLVLVCWSNKKVKWWRHTNFTWLSSSIILIYFSIYTCTKYSEHIMKLSLNSLIILLSSLQQ